MMEKVKIPQKVADAIETLRNAEYSDYGVVKYVDVGGPIHIKHGAELQNTLRGWVYENGGRNADLLLDALRSGYEIKEEYNVGEWKKVVLPDGKWAIGQIDTLAFDDIIFDYLDENTEWQRVRQPGKASVNPTPEEIKSEQERRTWAKIGREVGEFRYGDVGVGCSGNRWSDIIHLKEMYVNGGLKGFFPAESFVSFGGGEDA